MRRAQAPVNGEISFWYREHGLPHPRRPLPGDRSVDVAIVGAGFTGLWTAYYLKRAQPDLRIAVLEREFAGYGASGRNGGWLSAELAGARTRLAERGGPDGVRRLQQSLIDGVDEVLKVLAEERIDADAVKHGLLHVATNAAQRERLHEQVREERRWGLTEDDIRILDDAEREDRIRVRGAVAASYSPHCARVQPGKLVQGLAAAVERMGVDIYECTPVLEIRPRAAVTPQGVVRAEYVLRATEGFTPGLPGHRRDMLPMNSVMVVTEPLPADAWREIGWDGAELLGDLAHVFTYAQRTADGRIALGGRGIPYRFGSRTDVQGRTPWRNLGSLWAVLSRYFPAATATSPAHVWCGVLGVPRDWCAGAHVDHHTGLGHGGGYAGHGVTFANLTGRLLRDLVLRHDTELTTLPLADHRARRWEPEPLRWLGVRSVYALYRTADRAEARGGARTSRLARLASLVAGR